MIEDREAYLQRELEQYRAILWAYEHRGEVLDVEPEHAVQLVSGGAGVSAEAAAVVLDPDLALADWTDDDARRMRRALAESEAWATAPEDSLHPAAVRALAPLLADLERTGGPKFHFHHQPVEPGHNLMVVAYGPGDWGTGVWVDGFGDDEDVVDSVTDQRYDTIVEASDGAWPPGPDHRGAHALLLYTGGWKCRVTGAHIAELGQLGA